MAKRKRNAQKQLSVMVEPGIRALMCNVEAVTGVTSSRIINAALVQYMIGTDEKDKSKWMGHAMDIRVGNSSVADIARNLTGKRP